MTIINLWQDPTESSPSSVQGDHGTAVPWWGNDSRQRWEELSALKGLTAGGRLKGR